MLRRYKQAERIVIKKTSARLSRWLGNAARSWSRFIDGGRQSVSVLVVTNDGEAPHGLRVSLFGLAGACLLFAAVLVLAFALSGSLGKVSAKVNESSSELDQAQLELSALKDQTARLMDAYQDFQAALAPVLGAESSRLPALNANRLSLPNLFAKRRSEAQFLAEVSSNLDIATPIVSDYGSMLGKMNSIKRTVPAIWPINGDIGHISTTFGINPNPFTGQSYFHYGIDCSTYRAGDIIIATADGKVVFSGLDGSYGRTVIIAHAYGYMTRYGHMDSLFVHSGQIVSQGQGIGILGNSGVSTAPHTHYEVRMGKLYLDPTDFLWEGARSHPIITGGYGE